MDYLTQVELAQGWRARRFSAITSTNTELVAAARQGEPEGLCFVTEHQNAGKGRLGRSWDDSKGRSVLVSVLCYPDFEVANFFAVTAAMSLAALNVLDRFEISPAIKWPNDIMFGDAKIAGILAETGESDLGRFAVVGIGLNVNQTQDELDALGRPATSLRIQLGREVSSEEKQSFELALIDDFQRLYLGLQDSFAANFARLLSQYRSRCSTLERVVEVKLNDGESVSGLVLDISNQGHLLLELDSCIRTISAGDVHHLLR